MNGHGVSDHALRSAIDARYTYFICSHVQPSREISALRKPRPSSPEAGELFSECRGVFGSCTLCLTEPCTTVEKKRAPWSVLSRIGGRIRPGSTGWIITIVAYYRLGSCRSPLDWKWRAITGFTTPNLGNERDYDRYPPGSVMNKWIQSQDSRY